MTTFQKIIKYFAIALAGIIIVNIATAIFGGIYQLGTAFNDSDEHDVNIEEKKLGNIKNIDSLDIELGYTDLTIKSGNELKIKTNNNDITYNQKLNRLVVKEKDNNWFSNRKNRKLILYLPSKIFDDINIEAGAGKIKVDSMNTNNLELEIGAGRVNIKSLTVLKRAKIDGGVGSTKISDGSINNLNLEIGAGEFKIKSILTGDNTIEAGVGSLDVDILEKLENYSIKVEKGIGTIRINNNKVSDNTVYGTGNNTLKVEGGVGDIRIKTK